MKFLLDVKEDAEFKAVFDEYFKEMDFFDNEIKAKMEYLKTVWTKKCEIKDVMWDKMQRRLMELGKLTKAEVAKDPELRVDREHGQVFMVKNEASFPVHGGGLSVKEVDVPGIGKGFEVSGTNIKDLLNKLMRGDRP